MSFLSAFALASVLAASSPAAAPTAAPKLVLDEVNFDAGEVWRPAHLEHDFTLKNTGDADLTINVQPHCGCTIADYAKVIAPGKTGKVHLSVDTSRYLGPISKAATVKTNDPAQSSIELTLKGVVKSHDPETPAAAPAPVAPAPSKAPAGGKH